MERMSYSQHSKHVAIRLLTTGLLQFLHERSHRAHELFAHGASAAQPARRRRTPSLTSRASGAGTERPCRPAPQRSACPVARAQHTVTGREARQRKVLCEQLRLHGGYMAVT